MDVSNEQSISQRFDLTHEADPVFSGHLKLGGANPEGHRIGFTSYYMTWDDQPYIPIMGEFHFSRYDHDYWEEELLKIKAGGVDIVATYVLWIHIEEEEGQFNWSGNNNLRKFIYLCGKHDLQAIVRIGPFAHGECRNGGIPDWLYGRPFQVRSNDERYLAYVKRLYGQIGQQVEGLLFKDGGPVIGVQLENEYMHAGAPWEVTYRQGTEYVPAGTDGADHILKLKQIALEAGFDVPLYSCTGWLNSPIPEGEVLPMQGGYFFTPWIPDADFQQPPTREFLFRNRYQNPVINGKPTYDPMQYPYACCEIGGGTQDTYFQRNPVPPEAVEGLAFMNLADGANLIGYYMYHGGTNPVGKHAFLNEYTVPRLSYDFQAPLREFGQVVPSYGALRLLHTFLKDFGDLLAPMHVSLPDNAGSIKPEDTSTVRCVVRSDNGSGFLFLNNYQDHVEMQDLDGLRFELNTPQGNVTIPQSDTLTLKKHVSAILPFGLSLSGVRLISATTQLLAKLEENNTISYFFFAPHGMISEYVLEAATYRSLDVEGGSATENGSQTVIRVTAGLQTVITLTNADGQTIRFFTLTREQAEHTSKQTLWGKTYLTISDATVVAAGDDCWLYSREPEVELLIYPSLDTALTQNGQTLSSNNEGLFIRYQISVPEQTIDLHVEQLSPDKAIVSVSPDMLTGLDNVYLSVDYVGDIGSCYIDGKLVHDNFWNGTRWELGLKQLLKSPEPVEMFFVITPTRRVSKNPSVSSSTLAYIPPEVELGEAVIHAIKAIPEYKVVLKASS